MVQATKVNRIIQSYDQLLSDFHSSDAPLLVLSNYFTSKLDPVRLVQQAPSDFNYIQIWYESVSRHQLPAVIFHDGLDAEFIRAYETDLIRFIQCRLGSLSLNDERFIIFEEFVTHLASDKYVLLTDINDVIVNRNPSSYFESHPSQLHVGRSNRRFWKNSTWTLAALYTFSQNYPHPLPISFFNYPVFNPGTFGGRQAVVLKVLREMVDIFLQINNEGNYDMQAFNLVLKYHYYPTHSFWDFKLPFVWGFWYHHCCYRLSRKWEGSYRRKKYDLDSIEEGVFENDRLKTGYPFVSMFKKYETLESGVYLIHK